MEQVHFRCYLTSKYVVKNEKILNTTIIIIYVITCYLNCRKCAFFSSQSHVLLIFYYFIRYMTTCVIIIIILNIFRQKQDNFLFHNLCNF